MRYSTSRDAADRHSNALSRATIDSTDDSKLFQEAALRLYHDEQQSGIEHFHPYGFTSRVQPPTMQGTLRRAAEAIFGFLSGNRSHGVALVVGDRRFRMINLQNGEVAVHDDQGQWVYFRRGGILAKVPNANTCTLQVDVAGAQEGPPSGSNGQDATQIPAAAASVALSNSQIAATIGQSSATLTPSLITLAAPTICLASSDIRFGGMNATRALALQNSTDSRGDAITGNLSTTAKGV